MAKSIISVSKMKRTSAPLLGLRSTSIHWKNNAQQTRLRPHYFNEATVNGDLRPQKLESRAAHLIEMVAPLPED